MKTKWEIENGVKYSKKGLMDKINEMIKTESKLSGNEKTSKAWEQKLQ